MEEQPQINTKIYQPASSTPKYPKKFGKFIFIAIFILVLLGTTFTAVKLLSSTDEKDEEEIKNTNESIIPPTEIPTPTIETTPTTTPTPTTEPTNSPTPKPTTNPIDKTTGLNRSKLSIEVLNGSGIAGAAKKISDTLKNLGYNVIITRNAESFDYEKIVIEVDRDNTSFLALLKKDLSDSYSIGTTSSSLSATSSANARVIVGKD